MTGREQSGGPSADPPVLVREPTLKNAVVFCLQVGASAGILWLILSKVPFREVLDALRGARWDELAWSYLLFFLAHLADSRRQRLLTRWRGFRLSTMDLFNIKAASTFYRMAIPGGVGGSVIRWLKMTRAEGRLIDAAQVMIYDRLVYSIVFILMGCAAFAADFPSHGHPAVRLAAGVLAVGLLIHAAVFLAVFNGRWLRFLEGIGRRLPRFLQAGLDRVAGKAGQFQLIPQGLRWKVRGWALVNAGMSVLTFYGFARALNLPVPLLTLGWVRVVVYVLLLLPVTVAGLGVREGAMVVLLAPFGLASSRAVALSMLSLFALLLLACWGGCFELHGLATGKSRRKTSAGNVSVPDPGNR